MIKHMDKIAGSHPEHTIRIRQHKNETWGWQCDTCGLIPMKENLTLDMSTEEATEHTGKIVVETASDRVYAETATAVARALRERHTREIIRQARLELVKGGKGGRDAALDRITRGVDELNTGILRLSEKRI